MPIQINLLLTSVSLNRRQISEQEILDLTFAHGDCGLVCVFQGCFFVIAQLAFESQRRLPFSFVLFW